MQAHPLFRTLAIILAISIAYEPLAAQQSVSLSISTPVSVPTYTQVVPNVTTTQVITAGTPLTNYSVKPVPPSSPINVISQAGTNGHCATAIPATAIIQDCSLGNTAFESNMINLWLGVHGLPPSDASIVYQYGGIELRNELRGFMFAYIEGVIEEDPSLRSASDQALLSWIQNAVQANEIAYYQAATAEYNNWFESPCTFSLNATVAKSLGLSYDGAGYCGSTFQSILSPLPAPDVSYFKEVGQVLGYDSKISAYDGTVTNSALTGANIMLTSEQNNSTWASLGALGASIAVAGATGAIVAGNIKNITPYTFRKALNAEDDGEAQTEEAAEDGAEEGAEEAEEGIEIGSDVADVAGVVGIVLLFVQIGIQAAIDLSQSVQNQNAINDMINYGKTTALQPPNLNSMLQDEVGYQKVYETFLAATLPDITQTQGAPALPPIPSPTPANDVFYIINHTSNNQASVSNSFNYTTWDPAYAGYPGNPPYAQYGTSFNAYPFEFGFIQTIEQGKNNYTFFSPTIKYIDPNTGIRYNAELIDKGRFLVTKAPDDIGNSDFDCEVDPAIGLTQSPGTQIPTQCKSFVMNTLNIYANDFYNTTVQIPQPPVFATPNAANFSTAGSTTFIPQIDSTTQGLPCSMQTSGTLPPGFTFQNGALYLQVPSQAVPGTYQFNFVANCETLGLGTPFVNYTFGTAMTTQSFTANVYQAPSSSSSSAISAPLVSGPAANASTGLQFIFPASTTNITFTQGRSTTLTVETNGGAGTTISAGANALPPGMTLTDNGDGTASVSGIPTGPAPSCSSNCAITASAPGLASASLILNDTVAPPVLPTIPATQNATWDAAEVSIVTIDGSADTNGNPTNVPLTWSVVGALPTWVSLTGTNNNIAAISGIPPVSAVGQTIPIQFQYSYGGSPGFTSQTFTLNIIVNPPAPVLRVSPSLLFQVGVDGSGSISSSTLKGAAGLSGNWQVNATLPPGLTATSNGASLTISGTPANPGDLWVPIQFTDSAGDTATRNVAMMITQPASLANFPTRLVLFVGVPANFSLPVTAGFPRTPAGSPGDGLPSTTGTNLQLSGNISGTNGFTVNSTGGALVFRGTPLAAATYPLTVSAQTVLSTGPIGNQVSQPFTVYVQPAGDVNLDGAVDCNDYDTVKAHYGAVIGQPNYLDLADPNRDGVANILDLAFVQAHLPKGTVCH